MTKQDLFQSYFDWLLTKSGGEFKRDQLHEEVAFEVVDDAFDSHHNGQPIISYLSKDELYRWIFPKWKQRLLALLSNCDTIGGSVRLYRGCNLNYPPEYLALLKRELDRLETQCLH